MKLTVKTADITHLPNALEIIEDAKAFLKEQGIDQWQNGYPNTESIKNDIELKKGYFLLSDNEIACYFCLDFDGEPAYNNLKGNWKSDKSYAVIHRLAIKNKFRNQGLAGHVFKYAENLCKEKNIFSIRVDTDADNKIMLHTINKYGFEFCGTIWFDNSIKQAFEKIL